MHSRLAQILAEKGKEVDRLKKEGIPRQRENSLPPIRDFRAAICQPDTVNLIAEIKFASPSAGLIRENDDPVAIGQLYEEAGAAAISLVTDRRFFRGDLRHLPKLKKATSVPILRKDFIVDEIQVRESFLWGADAVLLIAHILSPRQLKGLLELCQRLGLAALTEVYARDDLDKALDCKADIIGINNRDLDTFAVDLTTTLRLAPGVPDSCILVSESGVRTRKDLHVLRESGIHAVLVGTILIKSVDIGKKAQGLVGLPRQRKGVKDGQG